MIATITEVRDISDIDETLATRPEHEAVTNRVGQILRENGVEPYILSTEACAECDRCAWLDGQPCRHPQRMHPCVESHGINVVPVMEQAGLEFQFGQNVVTWISLLFF
jgi:predicted metal-binding protein